MEGITVSQRRDSDRAMGASQHLGQPVLDMDEATLATGDRADHEKISAVAVKIDPSLKDSPPLLDLEQYFISRRRWVLPRAQPIARQSRSRAVAGAA